MSQHDGPKPGSHVTHITKRNGRVVVFDESRIADAIFMAARTLGGDNYERAQELAVEVGKKLNESFEPGSRPAVEEIQDFVLGTLEEHGHARTLKAYKDYRDKHSRLRRERIEKRTPEFIPYKVLWEVLSWNVDYGVDHVHRLNEHTRRGTLPHIIEETEKVYHLEVQRLAESVAMRLDELRLVIVAGPSSSGKTTTTIKLSEELESRNVRFVTLNLDNYFKNLEEHPKDEYDDYDFEKPEALDIPLINEHLAALVAGEEIQSPIYDFKLGKRIDETIPMSLAKNEIILLDSLHGLYGPLTESIPVSQKYKMYIEAMCQIKTDEGEWVRWADLRMLRRMVRDSWHRGYTPSRTVGHWHYVRRSELEYIVPFINTADFIFNGSIPYELAVLKKYLWPYLDEIYDTYHAEPKRHDAMIRARRIYSLLQSITPIADDSVIPKKSLLREYIGGSDYEY